MGWWLKIRRDISAVEVAPEDQRVPSLTPGPQVQGSTAREKFPLLLAVKTSGDCM